MLVNINGTLVNEEDAKISVFDHSFLYGDGVFDTMRMYDNSIFKFDEHINRLLKSADEINFRLPWTKEYLMDQIMDTLHTNKIKNARIRITVTRGEGDHGLTGNLKPNFVIMTNEITILPGEIYQKGVKIVTVNMSRFIPKAKSCNFLGNILAKQKADQFKAHEAILCNDNEIKEGSICNIFIVKGDKILTPKDGIVKGITRDIVIKIAKKFFNVEEKVVTKQDLHSAKECFLTNTTQEIVPVTKVDNVIIGNGKVGEITLKLMEEFKIYVEN